LCGHSQPIIEAEARLFIALYIDADITYKLAKALRERGFDAISAYEVGNADIPEDAYYHNLVTYIKWRFSFIKVFRRET
jgi:hypothetical protein